MSITHVCIAQQDPVTQEKELAAELEKKTVVTIEDIPGFNFNVIPSELRSAFKSIKITNPVVRKIDLGIQVSGMTPFLGESVECTITASWRGPNAYNSRVTIFIPGSWKFSDSFPGLKVFDTIKFYKVSFSYTHLPMSVDTRQEEFHLDIPTGIDFWLDQGFNIVGEALPAGLLKNLADLIGFDKAFVKASLPLDPETRKRDAFLQLVTPMRINFASGIRTTGLSIIITTEPQFQIETALLVRVPYEKDPLVFGAQINLQPGEVRVLGRMDGYWKNPFGIKGLKVEDVGIELSAMYPPVLPSGGGIRGIIRFAQDRIIEVAVKGQIGYTDGGTVLRGFQQYKPEFAKLDQEDISARAGDEGVLLLGSFEGGLYLKDLGMLVAYMIRGSDDMPSSEASANAFEKVVVEKLPKIGIEKAKFFFAPTYIRLADKAYPPGVTVEGRIMIAGQPVELSVGLNVNGFNAKGLIPRMAFGPFAITGAGEDMQRNTKDDGAILQIVAILNQPPLMFIDGRMEFNILGGIYQDVHIDITKSGMYCSFIKSFFNLYETMFEVNIKKKTEDLDFIEDTIAYKDNKEEDQPAAYVRGTMTNKTKDYVSKELKKACEQLVNKAKRDIEKARKETEKFWNEQIDIVTARVRKQRDEIIAALKKKQEELKISEEKIKNDLAALEKKLLEDSKKKFKKAKKHWKKCKKGLVWHCGSAGYYSALGGGEWTASKAMKAVRKDKNFIKLSKELANIPSNITKLGNLITKLSFDVSTLAPVAAMQGLKQASLEGLRVGGWSSQAVAEAGKVLSAAIGQTFNIREMSFQAAAEKLKGNVIHEFYIEGIVFGQKFNETLSFNMGNPSETIDKIAKIATNTFVKPFKKTKNKNPKPTITGDVYAQAAQEAYGSDASSQIASIMPQQEAIIIVEGKQQVISEEVFEAPIVAPLPANLQQSIQNIRDSLSNIPSLLKK